MHSGAKEKTFETENLKCAILTADCWLLWIYWNELFWLFFPLNLSVSELTPSSGDGSVWAEQRFLTADTKQETSNLPQLRAFVRVWACAVPQGRTPLGQGAGDPSWAARAGITAQMRACFQQPWLPPSWCWKGDDTPEGPNREGCDFETIFF